MAAIVGVALVTALATTGAEGRRLGNALKYGRTPEDGVATACVEDRCVLTPDCSPCSPHLQSCMNELDRIVANPTTLTSLTSQHQCLCHCFVRLCARCRALLPTCSQVLNVFLATPLATIALDAHGTQLSAL